MDFALSFGGNSWREPELKGLDQSMSDQMWSLDSLFEAAVRLTSAADRTAFLDQSCRGDFELRKQVELLLESDAQAASFLDQRPPEFKAALATDAAGRELAAALSPEFGENQAVVAGNASHSVLDTLCQTMDVPRVMLREDPTVVAEPIVRPNSAEMPNRDSGTRYQLQGEIARGGMGAILKGRDNDLGRDLAIKVLLDQHKDNPGVVQRFIEEAQIGGQLQHPGIVPIYELGQFADRRPFFAMKLVKGETLSKLLAARAAPAAERGKFLGIFEQVCQTMAYAHSRGVIHRDLKPANIMVGAFGEVQVMDWGLAKVLPAGGVADEKKAQDEQQRQRIVHTLRNTPGGDTPVTVGSVGSVGSQTQMGSVMGTPAYMPPEQALGEIDLLDERADVFGLGAILCEVLTGRPPYVADDGAQVFRMASRGKLEDCFLRLEACGADEDLVSLTRQCLELKPADRPRHAGVLVEQVTKYLESVETRLHAAEIERASAAARADAQTAQAAAERQRAESETRRVEQQQHSASRLRQMLGGLAVVALFAGFACVAALIANKRATDLAEIARKNAADANFFAGQATEKAKLASDNATRADTEATLARAAEQTAKELATTEAVASALAQQETERAEAATAQAKAQLTRSEWLLYGSRLMLAQTDFESGNGGLAKRYLDESQPNLRGWEHRFLSTRVNARQTLKGHTDRVTSVAYSPDGKRIVTGSGDSTAKVWDAETGQEFVTLKGHSGGVTSVAYRLDGRRIVTGSWDKTARVWDGETGQELQTFKGHSAQITSVAYSPDGKRLITGSFDQTAKAWDAATGQELFCLTDHTQAVESVAFSPDSKWIVTGGKDSTAKVWDAETGDILLTLKAHPRDFVYRAYFSPDGKRIVTISNDRTAKVWDAEMGQELLNLKGHANAVTGIAYSPDGQRIVTGSWDQTIKVWASQTGEEVFTLKGHSSNVLSVAFSPDGRRLVTGSDDTTAKVWEADQGQEIPILKGRFDAVTSMAFSADSQHLVTGSPDGTARVWNSVTGREVLCLKMHSEAPGAIGKARLLGVAISPDGQRIATASEDKMARVWDAATGEELHVLKHEGNVSGVSFSPDGRRLVSGCFDNTARVWSAETGNELLILNGHAGPVCSVAFHPDGKRIVTGSWDQTAKVWDAATGQELITLRGHAGYVMSVAVSFDGHRIVTGSSDNTAKVWDAATGQELITLKGHTGGTVRSVAFSPDGARIVTGSDDKTARLWDTRTGHEVLSLKGHAQAVYSVAWSPDGNRIVTGIAGANATVKMWDAATARESLVLTGHTEMVTGVAFSDDGQRIFAWDTQKNLRAWSVADGESVDPVDPPPEPRLSGAARSPDGLRHAVPEGNTVVVSDTSPLPENAWPLPNAVQRIRYHADQARLANQKNQPFAAEFHLRKVALAEAELVHAAE